MSDDFDDLIAGSTDVADYDPTTAPPRGPRIGWKPGAREALMRKQEVKVQAAQVERNHVINEELAAYTQSTSFAMNLGRTHVQAIGGLARNDWMKGGGAGTALRGLERRGLATHRPATQEELDNPPPFGETERWELTTAGKLMVLLLIEAGLLSPSLHSTEMPPPPPDWVDPRPVVEL